MSYRVTASTGSHVSSDQTTHKVVDVVETFVEHVPDALQELRMGAKGAPLRAAIIRNTVKDAQQMYSLLQAHFPDAEVRLLHSAYTAGDRMWRDKEVLSLVGKNGNFGTLQEHSSLCIIVGTQVLEQSLDIDFDVMFSDIAPLEYLLQRTGRLHRHNRTRPESTQEPVLHILTSEEERFTKGSALIYSEYRLLQAFGVIQERHNRLSYADILDIVQEGVEWDDSSLELADARATWVGQQQKKKDAAETFLIQPPRLQRNIYNWLDGASPTRGRVASEQQGERKVRDGVSGPGVIILLEVDGKLTVPGRGQRSERLFIPLPTASKGYMTIREVRTVMDASLTLPLAFAGDAWIEALEEAANMQVVQDWQSVPLLSGQIPLLLKEGQPTRLKTVDMFYNESLGFTSRRSQA